MNKFLVTQYPLKDTVVDFWTMVYDHECSVVVILESVNEVSFSLPWYDKHSYHEHKVEIKWDFPDKVVAEKTYLNHVIFSNFKNNLFRYVNMIPQLSMSIKQINKTISVHRCIKCYNIFVNFH